jgi:hypothetical protein
MCPHYEEDIFLQTGATSGTYTTGGIQVLVTKSVQIALFDHVTVKAVSSAPSIGYSGQTVIAQEVVGSESGQAFRLRAYANALSGVGVSGLFTELAPGSASLQGLPIHVSYEGT